MLRVIRLLLCVVILCAPAHAQYIKSKQGLMLWIDGYDMIRKAYTPNTPLNKAYPLEMMVRFCEVVWLPTTHHRKIKCWVFYDNSMSWTVVQVITLDRHKRVKCILWTTGDEVDISQWRRGRFTTYLFNRIDGMIWAKQKIVWSPIKQCFIKSSVREDIYRENQMSLYDIFDSVRVTFSLTEGRWSSGNRYIYVRFKPTGYIKKRLPSKYRDSPCVQAKFITQVDHGTKKSLQLSKCNNSHSDKPFMDWH